MRYNDFAVLAMPSNNGAAITLLRRLFQAIDEDVGGFQAFVSTATTSGSPIQNGDGTTSPNPSAGKPAWTFYATPLWDENSDLDMSLKVLRKLLTGTNAEKLFIKDKIVQRITERFTDDVVNIPSNAVISNLLDTVKANLIFTRCSDAQDGLQKLGLVQDITG